MISFEIIQPELGEISKWKHLSDQELCLYVMNMIDSSGLCGDWRHNEPESNSTSYLYGEHWSRRHHSASYLHDSPWNNRLHHEVENYYAKEQRRLLESERLKTEPRYLMSLVLSVVFSILALILLMTLSTQGGGGHSGGQGSSSSGSDHQRNPHQNSNLPDPQQNSNSKKSSN